ncbi:MAG: glycosyltransferase [Candidatus Latescibacterota bacterium]|jgi:colanic acid/amylovoran biosynthesis glycosyltransferase
MSTVAHCTALYLHTAGSWIHAQIAGLQRYRAVVLAQETANLAQFPAPRVYSAADRSPAVRLVNRVLRRLTGQYPFYDTLLRQERAALIHAHFGYEGARCLAARRASGLPLITSFYGADATQYARRPEWQRRYRRLFTEGEWFLVEGSAMQAQLAAIGCPPERIRIHHLGVDLARIPFRERQGEDRVRFLICAGLKEKKGIPYALRALAAALVARPFPFELVIVGDGPDRPALEALVGELGLTDQTRFRGMLPYDELLVELDRADLLLQTSVIAADGDTEGGAPVILLDAQAAGLPVVATRHADIPEYVADGEGGLLAAERDVDGLAACIRRLVDHPEIWAGMGRAGRRHVATQYDAATQARRLETLYDEFIGGNPATPARAAATTDC